MTKPIQYTANSPLPRSMRWEGKQDGFIFSVNETAAGTAIQQLVQHLQSEVHIPENWQPKRHNDYSILGWGFTCEFPNPEFYKG